MIHQLTVYAKETDWNLPQESFHRPRHASVKNTKPIIAKRLVCNEPQRFDA